MNIARRRPAAVLLVLAPIVAAGCQTAPEQAAVAPEAAQAESEEPTVPFSTKGDSVLGRDESVYEFTAAPPPRPLAAGEAAEVRAAAVELLLAASETESAILRANAIEALKAAPEHIEAPIIRGLGDENRGVRFTAVWAVGSLRLARLAPQVQPLLADPSPSVRAAAIYALHRCGRSVDPSPLAEMIMSGDPELRGNAAMVLGELGDPSALPMLEEALGRPAHRASAARIQLVDLQIAEARVKLGNESDLEVIRAALFAPPERGAELTALACQMCADLNDQSSVPTLKALANRPEGALEEPAEIRMAATQALATLSPSPVLSDVPRTYLGSERWELRTLAASTLGRTGDATNLPILATMMDDPAPMVRVAAAGGALRLTRRTH